MIAGTAWRRPRQSRRTGQAHQVVVGYFQDGDNLVTMAMNGFGAAEPAWWLNLLAQPDAIAQRRTM
jgi:hypothetical protein